MKDEFKFVLLKTGKSEIAINLDQVKYIRKNDKGQAVFVFLEKSTKTVEESYDNVISCLSTISPSEVD